MKINILIVFLSFPFFLISQISEIEGNLKVNNNQIQIQNTIDHQDVATKLYINQKMEDRLNAGSYGTLRDIDDNVYRTVKIGEQVWMADNLNVTHYNDGTSIPSEPDPVNFGSLLTPAYIYFDSDSLTYAEQCGAMYNYFAVSDTNSLKVCPVGWHVPVSAEWEQLKTFLIDHGYGYGGDGSDIAFSMSSDLHWYSPSGFSDFGQPCEDLGTNNASMFDINPCGWLSPWDNNFKSFGYQAWFHSFDQPGTGNVFNYQIIGTSSGFAATPNALKSTGMMVRCVRD